mgnify:CR=1 FL=1
MRIPLFWWLSRVTRECGENVEGRVRLAVERTLEGLCDLSMEGNPLVLFATLFMARPHSISTPQTPTSYITTYFLIHSLTPLSRPPQRRRKLQPRPRHALHALLNPHRPPHRRLLHPNHVRPRGSLALPLPFPLPPLPFGRLHPVNPHPHPRPPLLPHRRPPLRAPHGMGLLHRAGRHDPHRRLWNRLLRHAPHSRLTQSA